MRPFYAIPLNAKQPPKTFRNRNELVYDAVSPEEKVFATLAESAVEATLGDPVVNHLLGFLKQYRELSDVQDQGKLHTGSVGERLLNLGLRELSGPCAHRAIPFAKHVIKAVSGGL